MHVMEKMRSQTGANVATQMVATTESFDQPWAGGTKGGSGVPRSQGGILGQKPKLWRVCTRQGGDATATGAVT